MHNTEHFEEFSKKIVLPVLGFFRRQPPESCVAMEPFIHNAFTDFQQSLYIDEKIRHTLRLRQEPTSLASS